jgi:hypothetical protein
MREELLAWRSEGRRLAARRSDVIANGGEHLARDEETCATCQALTALARTVSTSSARQEVVVAPPTTSS